MCTTDVHDVAAGRRGDRGARDPVGAPPVDAVGAEAGTADASSPRPSRLTTSGTHRPTRRRWRARRPARRGWRTPGAASCRCGTLSPTGVRSGGGSGRSDHRERCMGRTPVGSRRPAGPRRGRDGHEAPSRLRDRRTVRTGQRPCTASRRRSRTSSTSSKRYWATTADRAGGDRRRPRDRRVLDAGHDEGTELHERVAYGLPALKDGRWWTFFTGMWFFAVDPSCTSRSSPCSIIVASVYERRVGHVRTLVVAIGGQFVAGLITALFLWPFEDTGWFWAREVGLKLDLGISAGGFAADGRPHRGHAAGVAQPHPHRLRRLPLRDAVALRPAVGHRALRRLHARRLRRTVPGPPSAAEAAGPLQPPRPSAPGWP